MGSLGLLTYSRLTPRCSKCDEIEARLAALREATQNLHAQSAAQVRAHSIRLLTQLILVQQSPTAGSAPSSAVRLDYTNDAPKERADLTLQVTGSISAESVLRWAEEV